MVNTQSMSQLSLAELEALFDRLWPLPRSITGNGLRDSLKILGEVVPLKLVEVPTGKEVFDWTIPPEWNVAEAYVVDPKGKKILDFSENNLHLVGYSIPFEGEMTRQELDAHLYSLPELPEAIPYVTSYYNKRWGFCLSQKQRDDLPEGKYQVVVRSSLKEGSLTYGHFILAPESGKSEGEILLSTYLCHPSMANNELSGPLALASLYRALKGMPGRRFSYRFVVAPETIGAIAYLSEHGEAMKRDSRGGFVFTCCGLKDEFTLKKSKRGDSAADRCAANILRFSGKGHRVDDFFPTGSDERQFCSPAFNLPVISISQGRYMEYPEYHTSLDNKALLSFAAIQGAVNLHLKIIEALEGNRTYRALHTECEPQLGKRGLYPTVGNFREIGDELLRIKYLLFYADGKNDLCQLAEIAKCSVLDLVPLAQKLEAAGLLAEVK